MKIKSRFLALTITAGGWLFSSMLAAELPKNHSINRGDVIAVHLHQLRPTQAAVGYDQFFTSLVVINMTEKRNLMKSVKLMAKSQSLLFQPSPQPLLPVHLNALTPLGLTKWI